MEYFVPSVFKEEMISACLRTPEIKYLSEALRLSDLSTAASIIKAPYFIGKELAEV